MLNAEYAGVMRKKWRWLRTLIHSYLHANV